MQPTTVAPRFSLHFLHPRYWGIWLALLVFLPTALLPFVALNGLAHVIAFLVWWAMPQRRKDTLTNMRIAYPQRTVAAQTTLAFNTYVEAALGFFFSLKAWFYPNWAQRHSTVYGLNALLNTPQATTHATIILGAHYSLMDIAGVVVSPYVKASIVYRPQNNAFLEWMLYHLRQPFYYKQLSSKHSKSILSSIKNTQHKEFMWYTPDQDFGLSNGVMAPFYSEHAATLTLQRKFVKFAACRYVTIHFYRLNNRWYQAPHFVVKFTPLADYPSTDEIADATRLNQRIAGYIDAHPEQYMWFHRRFKTRPVGTPSVYE